MDSAKLNDWMQVIGIFAIVASLLFVGLQMKQTQQIALSDAYQAPAASSSDRLMTAHSSPEYTSAMAKTGRNAFVEITPEERTVLWGFLSATFIHYENHHFQFESGFLPEHH